LRFLVAKENVSEPKPKREPKRKVKNDPKLVAAARELRDRWLEKVNSGQYLPELPEACGKYEVSRTLKPGPMKEAPLLAEPRFAA
jgi:hypothetical protein